MANWNYKITFEVVVINHWSALSGNGGGISMTGRRKKKKKKLRKHSVLSLGFNLGWLVLIWDQLLMIPGKIRSFVFQLS